MNQYEKIKKLEAEVERLNKLIINQTKKESYTTFELAKICNVTPSSVIKWCKQGKIENYTTPGGHRRITHQHLVDFMEKYKFPIPEGF